MNEPNQLDDFLKRKLSERVYEPDPSHWEDAERLIDAQQKRKKRRGGGWIWLLLLLGAMGSTLGFVHKGFGKWWGKSHLSAVDPAENQNSFAVDPFKDCYEFGHEPTIQRESGNSQLATLSTEEVVGDEISNAQHGQSQSGLMNNRERKGSAFRRGNPRQATNTLTSEEGIQIVTDSATSLEAKPYRSLAKVKRVSKQLPKWGPEGGKRFNMYPCLQFPLEEYPKNSLQLEVGIGLASGWNNANSRIRSASAIPAIGLNYTRTLKPGLRVMAGVRYTSRGALDSDSTFVLESRGFGFRDTLTTISPRMLHYVAFPIRLDARITGRHYLQVGIQPALLLNASGKLTQTVATDFGEQVISEENTWGYRQGFARTDVSVMLGYRYYVGKGLRLGLGATYGLRDQTDGVFFRNPRINRNVNLRFTLEYDLKQF